MESFVLTESNTKLSPGKYEGTKLDNKTFTMFNVDYYNSGYLFDIDFCSIPKHKTFTVFIVEDFYFEHGNGD